MKNRRQETGVRSHEAEEQVLGIGECPSGHRSIGSAGHSAWTYCHCLQLPSPLPMRSVGLVGLVRQIFYQIEMHGFICQISSLCLRIVSHSEPLGRNCTVAHLCTWAWAGGLVRALIAGNGPSENPGQRHMTIPCRKAAVPGFRLARGRSGPRLDRPDPQEQEDSQ
jgi:hypothetical protein